MTACTKPGPLQLTSVDQQSFMGMEVLSWKCRVALQQLQAAGGAHLPLPWLAPKPCHLYGREKIGDPLLAPLLIRDCCEKEELLLLSLWLRVPRDSLSLFHSANTWLFRKQDIPDLAGPDCSSSPHSSTSKAADEWCRAKYFAPLFQAYRIENKVSVMLTLRAMVDIMSLTHLRQLVEILLSGAAPTSFNRREWLEVVRDSLEQSPIAVNTGEHLKILVQFAAKSSHMMSVTTHTGQFFPLLMSHLCRRELLASLVRGSRCSFCPR